MAVKETPSGTPVGVDDPYDAAGVCDHLTSDGRCRFALTRAGDDPQFARERERDEYACLAGEETPFRECPHYRSTTDGRECRRCGLEEVRMAHDNSRPLLEEHHLSYGSSEGSDRSADDRRTSDDGETSHEITVALCRWCHAKIHAGNGRIDDDATPDPDARAERAARRQVEREEAGFQTAAQRRDSTDDSPTD